MNLSLWDKYKSAIPACGGDTALLSTLANGPLNARQAAASAITNLAWNSEIRQKLCDTGAIPSLVALLAESDEMAADAAVKALYNLASTDRAKVAPRPLFPTASSSQ